MIVGEDRALAGEFRHNMDVKDILECEHKSPSSVAFTVDVVDASMYILAKGWKFSLPGSLAIHPKP